MSERKQLVVIGGGPGGYAAAFLGADLGMQVTLIEKRKNPGGVCLYEGCIPSKALLNSADLLSSARAARERGIEFAEPRLDLDRLRAWKDGIVERLTGGLGQLSRSRKIDYIRGTATFTGHTSLQIETEEGPQAVEFENCVIATGSVPVRVPGLPDSPRIMDSTGALLLEEIPQRLLVIGGGYIGLEMTTVYAALGSEVTVVEMADSLMPGTDADLVKPLADHLKEATKDILLQTRVTGIVEAGNELKVSVELPGGKSETLTVDRVLYSIGRRPVTQGLGLENTAVRVNEQGFIQVNEQLRTTEPGVYAIGDVVGQPMLAHKASHEGRTAVEAIAGHKVAFEPNAIPAVVFTEPEIAYCGLTETEAQARGRAISVAKFPWSASSRAMTMGSTSGFTKLILDPETERVLGVAMVGRGAGELIAEGVLAVEMGALAKDLALSIHPHPTLSETVMEAAEVFFGTSSHVYRPRKI